MKKLLSKWKIVLIGATTVVMLSGCSDVIYNLMRAYQGVNQ